jgi:dTDP-4-amino-4,6-dideoxygalactose transaminase
MSGTLLNGKTPGLLADVAVYSYQAVKNLPTADSGMICFKEKKFDEICRKLSWLGINKDTYARSTDKGTYKWKYDLEYVGYKDHGNSIIAAIALVQLKYLDEDNEYRRKVCSWYDELFAPYADKIKPVPIPDNCISSRHLYVIRVKNRDELLEALNKADIYPGVHYRDNTEYKMYSYDYGKCPNAHRISKEIISLPLHLQLTHDDVKYIAKTIIDFVSSK